MIKEGIKVKRLREVIKEGRGVKRGDKGEERGKER